MNGATHVVYVGEYVAHVVRAATDQAAAEEIVRTRARIEDLEKTIVVYPLGEPQRFRADAELKVVPL